MAATRTQTKWEEIGEENVSGGGGAFGKLIARRKSRLDSSPAEDLTIKWPHLPSIVVWMNSNKFVQNIKKSIFNAVV